MKARDKRLFDLTMWAQKNQSRQTIPAIINEARGRYKVSHKTANDYAVEIMKRLELISKPMKVSDLYAEWQKEKDRITKLHHPKFVKASELE